MSVILELTAPDPVIARDGRPFGIGQGNRMRGLSWLLPSVVAGSFRTALVTATPGLDFTGDMPRRLQQVAVAGVFPSHDGELYLPAPLDCVWKQKDDPKGEQERGQILRAAPQPLDGDSGTDLPAGLQPVMLSRAQAAEDFKPATPPAWWPKTKFVDWLTTTLDVRDSDWFTAEFLRAPQPVMRDHVALDPGRGAAAESLIYATANLNVDYLPRHVAKETDQQATNISNRFAAVQLSARVTVPASSGLALPNPFRIWHPLGGERRLVHWQRCPRDVNGWACPAEVRAALANATQVRLILATPAIFRHGWRPDLDNGPLRGFGLKLVGACTGRWRAVSGWSLAMPIGPKPIRRLVPAGSVYFFRCDQGAAAALADSWLQPISDDEQEQRDGFGLALWGIW
ncbi:MAG: type III-B CRISPR module-associated protein Cmr3 [Gemmataceae bacterium]|nr:type III-B CRISPR module-associated protein Cmr3 [Gemmataceae bacterium]MDW8266397.1 type III-B CRISPR module-associated Cmr3 family protein [Gemmataceae bacterium]